MAAAVYKKKGLRVKDMIYVIDHYYAINHPEYCLIAESEKKVNEVVELCSAISFLLEDNVDVSACLNMECLLKILETYFAFTNRKKEVEEESLLNIPMPCDGVYENIYIAFDIQVCKAYLIDLYEARESCCGANYSAIIDKWFSDTKIRNEVIELLKREGQDT